MKRLSGGGESMRIDQGNERENDVRKLGLGVEPITAGKGNFTPTQSAGQVLRKRGRTFLSMDSKGRGDPNHIRGSKVLKWG